MITYLIGVLLIACAVNSEKVFYDEQLVIRILVNTTKQLNLIKEVLSELNDDSVSLWTDFNVGRFPLDIMVSETVLPIIKIKLQSINYSVIIKDVQKLIDNNMQIMHTSETFFSINALDTLPKNRFLVIIGVQIVT
jgi:hypothetical protein